MLYRRGRIWWTEFEHAGERYRLSTGERDRRAAAAQARRLRVETEEAAGPGGRTQGLALEMLEALDVERAEQQRLNRRSQDRVASLWRAPLRVLGPRRDANDLRLPDIDGFEGQRRAEGVRGQTIRREVQAIVRGLRLAKRTGLMRRLPFDPDDLRRISSDAPKPEQQSKPWTARQIAEVLAALNRKAVRAGWHDRLRLIQLTGLRLEELRRMTRGWVRGSELHVPASGSKTITGARLIPLNREALAIIRRWATTDAPPFAAGKPNRSLALACAKLELGAVLTPRDLRAFYITEAARRDLPATQRLAGHTSIATTSRYVHANKQRQAIAARAAQNAAKVPTRRSPQTKAGRRKGQ